MEGRSGRHKNWDSDLLYCKKCNKVYQVTFYNGQKVELDIYTNFSKFGKYGIPHKSCPLCDRSQWPKITEKKKIMIKTDKAERIKRKILYCEKCGEKLKIQNTFYMSEGWVRRTRVCPNGHRRYITAERIIEEK